MKHEIITLANVQHPFFRCPMNAMTMEWYNGTDIDSPDYQCGEMIPIELSSKCKYVEKRQ